MYYKFRKSKQADPNSEGNRGVLKIEVPHWAAEVRVFNCLLQPETEIGKIRSDTQVKSGYSLEAVLEAGAYQVQTTLEGRTESEWIPVAEGKVTQVSPKAWEKLKFTSASPIKDIDNFNKTHTDKAAELSRKNTWEYKNGGNSRLFLFVRTLDPQTYGETFSDGLELWNDKGEIITDFADGIIKEQKQGWMAFNADLPSGGYILRRGRRGVRLRHQVFYLCDDWETQIFLKARRFPSLSTWSLNMARQGEGFRPNDEALSAAEAITDNLRYGSNSLFLLQNEKIMESLDVLLDEKTGNPWLGVLAAHAILQLREQTESFRVQLENLRSRENPEAVSFSKRAENEVFQSQQYFARINPENVSIPKQLEADISQSESYFSILEQKVKPFLHRALGDHPDVRALLLSSDAPSVQPFDFPPSLLASLQQVQAHSLKFADTIPLNSWTDYVIDSLTTNAPWTAWRRLASQPEANLSPPVKHLSVKQSAGSDFSVSAVLSQTAVPRTPVYRFAESDLSQPLQSSAETVLQDAPMIQKVKEIVIDYAKDFEMSNLPEKINLNSAEEINKVLAQVTPEEISQNFGIPLSRTEEGLRYLHAQAAVSGLSSDEPSKTSPAEKSLLTVQQAILEHALSKFGKSESETVGTGRAQAKFTIREIVNKIQSEADRLCVAATNRSTVEPDSKISDNAALSFAEKLYAVAETLLKHADFVLITDERGKILYSNGAFLLYISPKSADRAIMTEPEISEIRRSKQKEWETILESAQPGLSGAENPHEIEGWRKWKLSRTEIEDQTANRSISYLNLLRLVEFPPLDEETLREVDSAAANLTFYTPILVYGAGEAKEVNEKNLREAIERLEQKVKQSQ